MKGNGRMEFNGFNRSMTLMQIGDASGKSRFEMIKVYIKEIIVQFKFLHRRKYWES